MCLAVVALDAHPHYVLAIAANRDELHARPTLPATRWPEGWIAGRDLSGGGTWLGVDGHGTWALLTNVREPERKDPNAPTRGSLVTRVLASHAPLDTLRAIAHDAERYNGFNMIAGRLADAAWMSNRTGGLHPLERGVHALSNAALDSPWPKVIHTRAAMQAWCRAAIPEPAPLFDVLASRAIAPDRELPRTGVSLERERLLSANFILDPSYGTRCSTVILVGHDGRGRFIERSFDAQGGVTGTIDLTFAIERTAA